MSDIVIKVENLSKQFRIGEHQGYKTFREAIVDVAKAPVNALRSLLPSQGSSLQAPSSKLSSSDDTIWALKDVSFEVKRGEVIGIIGRNGAGKSTLLKILSKITDPTYGRVELRGRVGSLLEVGTGFHPELTGHENVYLYGAILGMDRWEVTRKFDEIVAFAEIEKFIETPVKRYSSGMYMRLAFAVAAFMETEILLVDEVLAVGDASFQKKCLGKMGDVATEGRSVLFVSHNMGAVSALCESLILLEKGKIEMIGDPDNVIHHYLNSGAGPSFRVVLEPEEIDPGSQFSFLSATLAAKDEDEVNDVKLAEGVNVCITYILREPIRRILIAVELWDSNGICVLMSSDVDKEENPYVEYRLPGIYRATCHIPGEYLRKGRYFITIGAADPGIRRLGMLPSQLSFDVMEMESVGVKIGQGRRGIIAPILNWDTVLLVDAH